MSTEKSPIASASLYVRKSSGPPAIVIYAISYAYHKAKGVPIDLVAKELPPL